MKTFLKNLKTAAVGLMAVVALATVMPADAQNLGANPNSFQTVSNVGGYFNAANTLTYVTNNVAGLTNLLSAGTTNTPATLFSVWYNPSGTNGTFTGGTNAGFIPVSSSRFLSLDVSGTASALSTNTIRFSRSSAVDNLATSVETTPSVSWTFITPASGAFVIHTNIQDDADGQWQLSKWEVPTGSGNVTNPVVKWKTAVN